MQNLVCSVVLCLSVSSASWIEILDAAESSYDITLAQELVETLRNEDGSELFLAEALLILAELHRIEFEATDESARSERRALGKQIDAIADEAISLLRAAAQSSHQQRLLADLLGVKIRSNYQAKKYRKHMEQAAALAIELDSANGAAYVSAAKPYLFADERHRGDVDYAIELLETALEHNPDIEKAQLLLAHAHEEKGERVRAEDCYESVLQANSNCRPAREALERLNAEKTR